MRGRDEQKIVHRRGCGEGVPDRALSYSDADDDDGNYGPEVAA